MTRDAQTLAALGARVDEVVAGFLDERRTELAAIHPASVALVDEIRRLLAAGGHRLRPAFVYWGFRAAGGNDGAPILRAGAAVELLHTMAVIHDDLMDATPERRGVAASHVAVGEPVAILAGDLAAVFADQLLLESGIAADRLLVAQARYHRIRIDMAAGQYVDVTGATADPHDAAALKGGSYTVTGPLLLGADLAGGSPMLVAALTRFGDPLGRAFQLADDLRDGDAAAGITPQTVHELIASATGELDPTLLGAEPADALAALARGIEAA
jgi:geranylgeranyl diphosphate synthase, type I